MQVLEDEALAVMASAVQETHDGLTQFTQKLSAVDEIPTMWWEEHPIWASEKTQASICAWPLKLTDDDRIEIQCPEGKRQFTLQPAALRTYAVRELGKPLTGAEFAVVLDLAAGLSIEDSAAQAGVAVSTRRKQLQTTFRKLNLVSQAELISLANQLIGRFATVLTSMLTAENTRWDGYVRYLPNGVRCGVLEGVDHSPVRYLEIGPSDGKPVIILHPMVFPKICSEDVQLFHDLGLRTFWPIRTGCLSARGDARTSWASHCTRSANDIHTIQRICAGRPVPIIALVSSGAYATAFAEAFSGCVEQIDFVSTCFSSGKAKSKDVYFGDFLLRSLRQNGRVATVAIQHLATAAFKSDQLETTVRRVFKGSPVDQELLDKEFDRSHDAGRIAFALRHSISSIRRDYLSQIQFSWSRASKIGVPLQFWHGAQDTVHPLDDLSKFARSITGKPPEVVAQMGHLTQGAPMRETFRRIAATYSK